MNLRALVLCPDEQILRVLRRVLSDLEIDMEHCANADAAVRRLTRQRFEAVIVDCDQQEVAASVLKSVRSAPCNKHAVAVAMIDSKKEVKSAFTLGAHFVLYKPILAERAKSSFRAARALMKCERRRNLRVPIELPVTIAVAGSKGQQKATTCDLSEGGMAVRWARRGENAGPLRVSFALPGNDRGMECGAEVAWENNSNHAGFRFVDLTGEQRGQLKSWLAKHAPEEEVPDPPMPCKLTDLSLGGCYVEIAEPFPVRTRVTLALRTGEVRVEVEGTVRVTHAQTGMGVEFARSTEVQRQHVEQFIQTLVNSKGAIPQLEVQPEGVGDLPAEVPVASAAGNEHDPLLDLFRNQHHLPAESFLGELRRQRGAPPAQAAASAAAGL
jgi:c-di-GMP-binding flagellar brake protein YcgR